jgi:hypothetical protein
MKDSFFKELSSEKIHFRNNWQFELKSDFPFRSDPTKNLHSQEFYFFIPNSLRINNNTYSRKQFYQDQGNIIRLKTPEFSLAELIDLSHKNSPLATIQNIVAASTNAEALERVKEELKLFANVVRSTIRNKTSVMLRQIKTLKTPSDIEKLHTNIIAICHEYHALLHSFAHVKDGCLEAWPEEPLLKKHFSYIEEFITNSTSYYFTGFLSKLRKKNIPELKPTYQELHNIIIKENNYHEELISKLKNAKSPVEHEEQVLYRKGLLNKFVFDALFLSVSRAALGKRIHNLIGSLSAGIAMMIYLLFFIWQGTVFAINSEPFIILSVLIYILKDRIKEALKAASYRLAFSFFPDYTTKIFTPDRKQTIGKLKESVAFIDEEDLPDDMRKIRNEEFHNMLETFKRPERILFYRKNICIDKTAPTIREASRSGLNIIFRFNILQFIKNASTPYHTYVSLDPNDFSFIEAQLPKVYHLNIIMKNTYTKEDNTTAIELKKFRLIIDQNGIKRVDNI